MLAVKNKINTLKFFFKPRKIVAQYKLFFGDDWLETSVDSIAPHVYKVLFVVSDIAWGDDAENPTIKGSNLLPVIEKLKKKYPNKIVVINGSWNAQVVHVQAGLEYIKKNIPEVTHCLYIDGDEIYPIKTIKKLKQLSLHPRYFNKAIRMNYHTYFKSIYYRITPPKYPLCLTLFPVMDWVNYRDARNVNASIADLYNLFFEHPAYVRKSDEDMRIKIEAHRETEPIIGDWYEEVWLNWTPSVTNFHPTHPDFWERVEKVPEEKLHAGMLQTFKHWNIK